MKTSITINNQELEVILASKMPLGFGHYKINVHILNHENMKSKYFASTTSNMSAIDAASELEGDEKYMALYEIIASDIQDQLEEFVSPLINE